MEDFGRLADFLPLKAMRPVLERRFRSAFLILLLAGARESTGYEVVVDSIRFNESTRELAIHYRVPGPEETKSGGDPEISYPCIVLGLSKDLLPGRVTCLMDEEVRPLATFLEGYR